MNTNPNRIIRILLLEDEALDAELICGSLEQSGLRVNVCLVSDEQGFRACLESVEGLDLILSDFSLPTFDGLSALMLRCMLAPKIPFIFVTGALGEDRAVEMMHIGASDYVTKNNLSRLPMAVLRALAEADAARIQNEMEEELNQERQLLGAVLSTSGALIVLVDHEGKILRLNPAAAQLIQMEPDQATHRAYLDLFVEGGEREQVSAMLASLEVVPAPQHLSWHATIGERSIMWSAGRLPEQGGSSGFAVISGIDVSAQEKAERQAYYLKNFDEATGLPRRDLLLLRMGRLLNSRRTKQALVMVGVARLQDVRDSLGEKAADQLLREVARRLLAWQLASDCLARIGDESFALVIESGDEEALKAPLREILVRLHEPYMLNDRPFFLTACMGVAPCDGRAGPEEVLKAATVALHRAVEQPGENFHFYQPLLTDEARARLELIAELHEALRVRDQLILHYQPQVEISSGRIVGLEALMRWKHPRLGLVPPNRFIPLAESSGLIAGLGEYALEMACRQAAAWQRDGLPSVPVAVNLSALQWSQPDLADTIRNALSDSGLSPRWLELELTESASMHDPAATLSTMGILREMGVQVSIDDFGTGFCNLSYLKRFTVDKLKIDQSFVREITSLPDDLVISQLVLAMGNLLHLSVVAEGVETEGQLMLLAEAGCNIIQGYYFSRPVEPVACAQMLGSGSTMPTIRRHYHPRCLLWFDPFGGSLQQATHWFEGADYQVLVPASTADAFELLATHEVGVVVCAQDAPELDGRELLARASKMYPATSAILICKEGETEPQENADYYALFRPLSEVMVKTAIQRGFALHERELRLH